VIYATRAIPEVWYEDKACCLASRHSNDAASGSLSNAESLGAVGSRILDGCMGGAEDAWIY
jgi:hypothetical protein